MPRRIEADGIVVSAADPSHADMVPPPNWTSGWKRRMRVRLTGINPVSRTLADGSVATYYYAWRGKGAPRLPGRPGSAEFVAAYNEAVAKRVRPSNETLVSLLQVYQQSDAFRKLRASTRADYVKQLRKIEAEFADFPIDALADKRTRGIFRAWRDRLALKSRRQADYAHVVLQRVLSWAPRRRHGTGKSVCEKRTRLQRHPRRCGLVG